MASNPKRVARNDPERVGPKIEARLQKELGISASIPWEVEGESRRGTVHDVLVAAFGGKLGTSQGQYQLTYTLPTQQPSLLQMGIIFVSKGGWVPGTLTYAYDMAPVVPGIVSMTRPNILVHTPKVRHISRFAGMEDWTALNLDEDVLVGILNLLRSKVKIGNVAIQSSDLALITPNQAGSTFYVVTLMKVSRLGFKTRFQAREFIGLAVAVERAIGANTSSSS